ncbi:MAG: amidohydrolase family protein [Rhodobacter sp.]|nr:amidohydrolase family protein [Rhodobacter sp.]
MTPKPVGPPPVDPPSRPGFRLPDGACDAHFHMLGGPGDFPLWEGRVEDPAPGRDFDGWLDTFRIHCRSLGISRGVVVHSIFYGADNAITLEAARRLGPGFKSICLVTNDATEAELDHLADNGCAGVRLNYVHGGVLSWEGAKAMAPRLAARGMHIQMLMNAHEHMAGIAGDIRALPVPVVFDHIGWPDVTAGPGEPGFETLCRLLAEGCAYAKLSGIYRLADAPYGATDAHVAALAAANPERCLWGSDWPHIMLADAQTPDSGHLLDALARAVPSTETQHRIFVENSSALYGF